jgi:hypothetical protein
VLLAIESIVTVEGIALLLVTSANVTTQVTTGLPNNAKHTTGDERLNQDRTAFQKLQMITEIFLTSVQLMV